VRSRRRLPDAAAPPLYSIWFIPGAFLLTTVAAGHVALRLEGVPYNVKELFQSRPTVSLALLGALLLACGGAVHLAARTWQLRPYRFAALCIPAVWLCALAVFSALSLAVPTESLEDIVGAPVLGIGATLERSLRFTGLMAGPFACCALGARLALGDYKRGFLVGLAPLLVLLPASYLVVVPAADTDNVVELLRGNGRSLAVAGLPLLMILFGFAGAVTAAALEAALDRVFGPLALAAVIVACSVPVTWQLFVVATNPRLQKYGRVFSARQFLFSPDRDHYLADTAVFFRFALVLLLAVGVFAAAMLVARLASRVWPYLERR